MTKKSFFISALVVLVQYYDYHLFGFMAAKISEYFFPTNESIIQLLNTYIILWLGIIAKPVGALILGKIGDLKGRSSSFTISLIASSIASLAIYLTPSYQQIGMFAVFILLSYRLVVCAFASSGSDGVRIFIYEHIHPKNQCLGVGLTALFTMLGSLIASFSVWFFTLKTIPDDSWRFSFLVGSILGIIAIITMYLMKFSDSIKIAKHQDFDKFKSLSVRQIINKQQSLFILCLILAGSIGASHQFIIIFFGTYNFKILHTIDHSTMKLFIAGSIITYMIFAVISGFIADKFNRYKTTIFGVIGVVSCSIWQGYFLSQNKTNPYLFMATTIFLPFITIPAAAIFKAAIPISIRYRIFSLSHAVGSIIISAPTAFICTFIYQQTNLSWLPIYYFITIILVISYVLYKLHLRITNSNIK
ncbi:MAG: MFS transporter [Rickettsiaceae bacterium]|nr:MFS transporter [Rickettsiaceae bacterium]